MFDITEVITCNRKPIVSREENQARKVARPAPERGRELLSLRRRLVEMIVSSEARRRTSFCHG